MQQLAWRRNATQAKNQLFNMSKIKINYLQNKTWKGVQTRVGFVHHLDPHIWLMSVKLSQCEECSRTASAER